MDGVAGAGRRLRDAVAVDRARLQQRLASIGGPPGQREALPGPATTQLEIGRSRPMRAAVDADLHRRDGAERPRPTQDLDLLSHGGDGIRAWCDDQRFGRNRPDRLGSVVVEAGREQPVGTAVGEMQPPQPLDAVGAIEARHDEPQGKTVLGRQRHAVDLVRRGERRRPRGARAACP